MSKFFKSLLLLLSAGLFTATSWADSLIARWDNFTGLTAENSLSPSKSATVNGLNGGLWKFNLGGGSVTDGVLATGTGSAPNIEFDEAFEVGRTSKPITVLVAVKLPYTPVANKPILHIGNGTVGYGLVSMTSNKVASSWLNAAWNSDSKQATFDALEGDTGVVYLVYSVADTSTNASVTSVTLDTATYTWQTFGGLTGTGVSSSKIVFGNFVDVENGGLDYDLKSVAVFNGAFAPLADVKDVIRAWEGIEISNVSATISEDVSWTGVNWSKTPTNVSNVTLIVEEEATLTVDATTTILSLDVEGTGPLTITGSSKLSVGTMTVGADTVANLGTLTFGSVDLKEDNNFTLDAGGANRTVTDKISGTGKLTIAAGSGKWISVKNSGNDFSGDVEVTSGTLYVGNSGNENSSAASKLGTADSTVTVKSGAGFITHMGGTFEPSIVLENGAAWGNRDGHVTYSGNVSISGDVTYAFYWNKQNTISGLVSGSGSLTISGPTAEGGTSKITLSNEGNTFSGMYKLCGTDSGKKVELVTGATAGVASYNLENAHSILTLSGNVTAGSLEGSGSVNSSASGTARTLTISKDSDLRTLTISNDVKINVTGNATALVSLNQATKITEVATGATLKVALTTEEQRDSQTVTVTGGGKIIFVDADGNTLAEADGESQEDNAYTPPISEYTYIVGANDPWGGVTPVANAKIKIDFGKTEGQTVNLTAALGDITTVTELIVTGTNGGTIAKSETAGAVTTARATINTAVTVNAGVATFTATEIPAEGALTVADTETVSAVSGAGVLAYNGVLPANMTGVTDAATWTGTLALVSTPAQADIAFNSFGNASSTVRLQDYTGSLSNKTAATCYTPNLEIKGTNAINAATEYAIPIFQGDVSGDGTIVFSASENTNYLFSGDFSAFTGTMELTHTSPKIAIGAASNTDWNAWNPIVQYGQGNITIATAATLNGTFRAVRGVETTSSAILSGNGTIDCSLTLAANATIDASATLLTVTGDITLPNTLTVKVAETPTAITPVSILTTTATPNVENTTVTVIVNGTTLEGNFELVKNGDKLQVRVAPERITASETPVSVTEVPSAIFLDTATFSGYGQTFTVLQYTGKDTPNWDDMYVEGLPEGAQVVTEGNNWGFKNNCLNVLTVGDSITAGLVYYYNSNANWHVPGGYRLPLYKRLTRAGYSVKYLGSSDVFGTSSVGGNNANEANPSPSLGDNDHHEGHSGITLDTMISRFGEANVKAVIAAQGTPDVITLHLGTNDFGLAGDTVENAFAEMKKLLYLLNGACDSSATDDWKASVGTPLYPNATIFVAKIMPRADSGLMTNKIDPFNEDLAEYVTSCNLDKLVLVDLGMANNYGLLRHDGLHPSTEGYAQMAKGWYEAIDTKFDPYGEVTAAPAPATSTPTEDVTESDRAGNSKTKGVLKAAEWTDFTGFATGFTSQFGYMQDSERPWQLDIRGEKVPTVADGVLSLNGAPITVNPVDGRLGTTISTYTIVMKVSDLAANDVIFTDSSVACTDWPSAKGTTNADLGKLTVVDADTLQWTYNGLADGPTIDLVGVNLTDSTPDVIAITVTCNQCKVAVNGGAAVTVSQDSASETYRGSWSIGAMSTADTGSSMKLHRLSFYEGEATLPPPATVTVNVGDYASWNAALEAGAVSTAMASVTLNFTEADQTFTFDNTSAVTLGITAVTAAEGVTGGTIALVSNVEVKMASLSLQTNVTAPVAFYNACIGSITADSATTVVAMNDATEATLTTPIVGGVLKQVGEGTITFAPTGNWTASTSPAKFEVANGSLVLNKTSTGWNNPPQLIVFGGTLDLNNTYTFATDGSGYLKNVANEALVVMGGTEASTVTNGAITPYTANANTASTIIKYNGAEGANAPATFAANIAGVYSDGNHPRLINVEQGKQTDGYDLEISGTMGVEGQQFAGATVKKTGAGVLKISGENNFNILEVTEGTLWSANANALSATTTVKSGATLVGAGTVATAFTLEANATLDVTKGVVTANGTVSLPNALKLVVETLPTTAETHVTILSTTAFADATGDVDATLTINGNAAPDYILRKTANAVELHYAPWTTVPEVTASGNVKSWSALLAGMEANRQVLDASTGVFIIDFGNADGEAVPGSFEFDNTEPLTFASVKVMGSNGGTITKTGSGAVSVTATTIEEGCTVTVPASTATLNAVEIKQNATLKVADVTTVTTATGVGTLYVAGIDGNVGLKLKGVSADTKVVLDGVRCYIDNGGNGKVECPIEIGENGFTIMNGWATGSIEFSGALTGEGLLTYAPKQNGAANGASLGYLLTLTNATGFEGGITLDGENTKVVIGSGTAVAGKIVIADSVTIANEKTWTATNGISVTGEGTISGAGTISIPSGKELTYASTAESTFSGTIEGAGNIVVDSGEFTFAGTNSLPLASTIIVNGGKLVLGSAAIPTFTNGDANTSAIQVNNDATLELTASTSWRKFTGTGNILVSGNYTMGGSGDTPTMTDGFEGTITVDEGVTLTLQNYNDDSAVFDASKLIVNGSIVKSTANYVKNVSATVAALSGSGTIGVPLTLAEGATIDATDGVVTANTITALPTSLKVVLPDAVEMPVTLLNTTAFAGNVGEVKGVTLTVNGEQTGDYLLNKTATALTLDVAPWTTVTEVTASGDVNSWSELLAAMEANRQRFDTSDGKTPSLIIDFGSEGGEAGTFTFDNSDAVELAKVTILGTNGGTIQKTGTGAVTVQVAEVNTATTVTGQVMLNGVTIAENGVLSITDWRVIGDNTIAGAGLLTVTGATLPTDVTVRVTDAWTGTVKLTDITDAKLNLANMVTANSNLILNNVKAYIYDCKINTLTLEGNFQMNDGNSGYPLKHQCITINTLTGDGEFLSPTKNLYQAFNIKNVENYIGSLDLTANNFAHTVFFFGDAPQRFTDAASNVNTDDDAQEYFKNDYGTVYVAGQTVATDATSFWKLRKLVVENGASFQIKGWATLTASTGAVSVERGATLDLRALDDLSGINATVEAGGRILVKSGATVPDTIVFESEEAILGICPVSVDDIGNATLTVNVNGSAATTAKKVGYKTDGVTELGNWTNKGAQDNTLSFGYDPIFDGELCWWAYEFDKDENTTSSDLTDGPDNTGRDKTSLEFDGKKDNGELAEGRILVGDEYVTNGDGTKALRLAAAPHRKVDPYPTAFTATVYGKLTSQPKTILWGFGSTFNSKDTIALVTGTSANEVNLIWVKGSTSTEHVLGSFPKNCVTTLATTTVPNGTTEDHLFGFSYELKDVNGDGTKDTTEIVFYVDGDKYQPFKVNKIITLGGGFQTGSLHGGWPREGIAPTASDWLNRMGDNEADKAATIEFLRVYDKVIPEATFTAMAKTYPYISKVGCATRTIVAGADTTWHEATDWSQTEVVLDVDGNFTYNDDGSLKFQTENQKEPNYGTIDEPEVGTQVVLNVDGANTLYLNEFYSTTTDGSGNVTTNGNSKLYYERLEINDVAGGAEDSLTMWAGRENPAVEEENKNSQSAVLTVLGYTKINTNVTLPHNVAYLSGPVAVAEGKTLTFDFSKFDVMKVPEMPVEYRLTGFLDEETRERVTHNYPDEWVAVNARSVDLGYKTDVNQYVFRVDRYPLTAVFTKADGYDVGMTTPNQNTDPEINFNNLYYWWQNVVAGKQMDWNAQATLKGGTTITEDVFAKFGATGEFDVTKDKTTVTLTTNLETMRLSLKEEALKKTIPVTTTTTTTNETTGEDETTSTTTNTKVDMFGSQQLIIGDKVIIDYTGDAATLARTLNEASAETTGVIRTAGFTVDAWRANLSVTKDALAGVGKISGKVTFETGATLDASAATAEACLSAKDADLTNLKAIKVNYDAAAGKTLKVLSLPEGHTAKSLIGCTVTAVDGEGNTVATWTESNNDPTKVALVVVREGGLYVTGRPVVKAGETEVKNNDLTLPLARRAAELSATSVSLTGVVNTAGETVNAPVAAVAEVFTNVAFDMSETVVDGVVTAKLKYDFGVSDIAVVTIGGTEYVVAELIVSNHTDHDQNSAAYADGTTIDVTVTLGYATQEVRVEAAADMTGADVATAAELPASTRYIRFELPEEGRGTFKIKARATKNAQQ